MAVKLADFFCGCGGTSAGLQKSGMEIVLGLDFDADSAKTYKANFPLAKFIEADINSVSLPTVRNELQISERDTLVFAGCAPCQPFSKINTLKPKDDSRRKLLQRFGDFIEEFSPDYIIVENVPGLQQIDTKEGPFKDFLNRLELLGYGGSRCRFEILQCQYFGVPQRRRRLVLVATKHGEVAPWPLKTHGPEGFVSESLPTVWEFIGELPLLEAGGCCKSVPDHQCMNLSAKNLQRIIATPAEKGREAWPDDLKLECHKEHSGHTDVYGRLRKHSPAAALTTKCISLSNGRFGHPEQNRALSIREAALLQTFPLDFQFFGSMGSKARQIGNAVPVSLATQIGLAIIEHDRVRRVEEVDG